MALNLGSPINQQSPLTKGLAIALLSQPSTTHPWRDYSKNKLNSTPTSVTDIRTRSIVNGHVSQALASDGVSARYATITNNAKFKSSTTGVSCWFYAGSVGVTFQCIWCIYTSDSDAIELFLSNSTLYGGNYSWQVSETGINANQWYHTYFEANGTSRKLWVNGRPASTPSGTSSSYGGSSNSADLILLSRPSGSFFFNGGIADFQLFIDRPANDDFVRNLYLESLAGYPTTLNRTKKGFATTPPAAASFNPAWARGSNVLIRSMA